MSPRRLSGRSTGVAAAVVAIAAFLLGMGAGAATVALAFGTNNASQPNPGPPVPTLTPTATTTPQNGSLALSRSCLQALEAAQTITADVQGLGAAVKNFDAAAADRVVQQLQRIRPDLQDNLSRCRATVQLPDMTPSPSPVDAGSPTPSPSP